MKQLRGRAVLANDHIETAIAVVISHSRTALFSVNFQSTFLTWNCPKRAMPITPQQKSASTVVTRGFRLNRKKILSHHHVLMAVRVEIADTNTERRRELRLNRQGTRLEMIATI